MTAQHQMSPTRVAVLSTSEEQRHHLQSMLEQSGLSVVLSEEVSDNTLNQLSVKTPDVLLIDIGDSDAEWNHIDIISEQSTIPILFNDSGVEGVSLASSGEVWAKKLAMKLNVLAGEGDTGTETERVSTETPFPMSSNQALEKPELELASFSEIVSGSAPAESSAIERKITDKPSGESKPATRKAKKKTPAADTFNELIPDINVWVLGASLGGPQAVRQFLATISEDLPVAFVLAQHIGANHINLLAEQLNRVTSFEVVPGKTGHLLQHGEVILTPADKEIGFRDDGTLTLKPASPSAIYSPSIDNVMKEVARCFGKNSGTIVFSGMGDDGAEGCQSVADSGGIVWAQDIASCVVSSMPDRARKTGRVSYSANPEQLAEHLYGHYCSSAVQS